MATGICCEGNAKVLGRKTSLFPNSEFEESHTALPAHFGIAIRLTEVAKRTNAGADEPCATSKFGTTELKSRRRGPASPSLKVWMPRITAVLGRKRREIFPHSIMNVAIEAPRHGKLRDAWKTLAYIDHSCLDHKVRKKEILRVSWWLVRTVTPSNGILGDVRKKEGGDADG